MRIKEENLAKRESENVVVA
ncbi:uncharacterized protein G2W53_025274 [Senna tora]|uniref:Uncharacterized protein n=1 Tax=Senna tora TaxID=362788 RepID=A0A834TEK1_9FABA|nr:uncharacterized protein G2W53_025274 [Senna tora]